MKRSKQAVPVGLTPYAVLAVPQRATDEVVRRAYHGLITAHHPDKRKDKRPGPRWEELNRAYKAIGTGLRREEWVAAMSLMSGGCSACRRYGVTTNGAPCTACKGKGRIV